jgi:hypothetical protein
MSRHRVQIPRSTAEPRYVYRWRNNPRRDELYGRVCRLVCSGTKNTVLLEFVDTGERVTTSRWAIRRVGDE